MPSMRMEVRALTFYAVCARLLYLWTPWARMYLLIPWTQNVYDTLAPDKL